MKIDSFNLEHNILKHFNIKKFKIRQWKYSSLYIFTFRVSACLSMHQEYGENLAGGKKYDIHIITS